MFWFSPWELGAEDDVDGPGVDSGDASASKVVDEFAPWWKSE